MIKKLKNKIEKIQNKSEETKIRIIWTLAFFGIIIMAGAWYLSLGFNSAPRNNDKSLLSSFPDWKEEINNIGKMSEDYKTIISDVADEAEKTEIQKIVENYIIENNYLEDLSTGQASANISNLKLKTIEKLKNNWYVEYEQYYNGFLVDGSRISFQVDDLEKKVTASESNFDQDIKSDIINPKISEDEAFNFAVEASKKDSLDLKNSQLVFYKDMNKKSAEYNLAWKINVFSLDPAYDYVYFVNAEDGRIISAIDNLKN